jgi:alanine dehydrogenase
MGREEMERATRKTIGLPRMIAREGFRREFLPDFVGRLIRKCRLNVVAEEGYGSDLGLSMADYPGEMRAAGREEIFRNSDYVLSLTSPAHEDIGMMGRGQMLIAMLHYPTRPERNQLMRQRGICAISLDSLVDWNGERMVEDLRRTAWNAVTAGYIELRKAMGDELWFSKEREELEIYLIGTGAVGKQALNAAMKMGNTNYLAELEQRGGNPFAHVFATASLHSRHNYLMEKLGRGYRPDMIIDTSLRCDPTKEIITRDDLKRLPEGCVILDVVADEYEGDVIKGISGTPTGNEHKFVFYPGDAEWTDPARVPPEYQIADPKDRRIVVSHHAWPAYGSVGDLRQNMAHYGNQIFLYMRELVDMNLRRYHEEIEWSYRKSLYQASLDYCLDNPTARRLAGNDSGR